MILPTLGAVPDAVLVIFSAMGEEGEAAQEKLDVGMGALAGSTVMLLTIPWGMSIIAGRVGLRADGTARYGVRMDPESPVRLTARALVARRGGARRLEQRPAAGGAVQVRL